MNFDTVDLLYTRKEIHTHVMGLWQTPEFRKAHYNGILEFNPDSRSFIFQIVDKFADLPRFFFEMTDYKLEYAHFSTWWGGIPYRKYTNPYIHDLYLIHEMSHAGEMVYVPGMKFDNFLRKMIDNELHASVVSEIQVYLEMPGLREKSFKHPIYADRFLGSNLRNHYKLEPKRTFEELKIRRRDTMMNSNPVTLSDKWINRFYNQNAAWGACWEHRYDRIEWAMSTLRNRCLDNENGRAETLNDFINLLKTYSSNENTIPFLTEAQAFAGVYWANRAHYDLEMATNITKS